MSCCFVGWRPKFIVCQFCFIFINFPKLLVSCRDESFGCFGSLNTHPMSKYASGTDIWSLGATCLGTKLTGKFHRSFLNIRQEAGPQKGKSSSNLKCFRCQLVGFLGALKSSGSSGSTWWPWEICLLVGGPRWWIRVAEAGRMRRLFHSGPSKMCKEYLKLALITGRAPPLRPCFTALASTSSPAWWVLISFNVWPDGFVFFFPFFAVISVHLSPRWFNSRLNALWRHVCLAWCPCQLAEWFCSTCLCL